MRAHFREGLQLLTPLENGGSYDFDPGDLVYSVDGVAVPVNEFTWATDAAKTCTQLAREFAGVCATKYRTTDLGLPPIVVDCSPFATYCVPLSAADVLDAGEWLRPADAASVLSKTNLVATTAAETAIAVAVRNASASEAIGYVRFLSRFFPGHNLSGGNDPAAAITDALTAGSATAANCATTINSVLAALRTFGIVLRT